MTICILGRQPELGLAELERLYGPEAVQPLGTNCARVDGVVDFERLGGCVKSAKELLVASKPDFYSVMKHVTKQLPDLISAMPAEGKIKLAISVYGDSVTPYDISGAALQLKKIVRKLGRSVRIVPNETPALSSAQTFHNGLARELGLEIVLVKDGDACYVGVVNAVQNIDAYRIRDRERPKRDAFVGMLPPKLAQIIVNLSVGNQPTGTTTVLDPFCGTGVVLQEAALMGYVVYGSDINQKMIDYSRANLEWLQQKFETKAINYELAAADATSHTWKLSPLSVAAEGYLGQPLGGQSPSKEKLASIVHDSGRIVRGFLKNIAPQLPRGSQLCLAVPTWFTNGMTTRLELDDELAQLGFSPYTFTHVVTPLIYRREDQITGRELLVLERN